MSTTPGALLSDVVGGWAPDLTPTPAEREAMATDLHVLACLTPGGECIECMSVFRAVRKYLNAAVPLIEEQARSDERADLDAAGRLLPDGGEVHTQWTAAQGPERLDDEFEELEAVYLAALQAHWQTFDLLRRELTVWPDGSTFTTSWSPVVAHVEVSADAG